MKYKKYLFDFREKMLNYKSGTVVHIPYELHTRENVRYSIDQQIG